MGPGRTEPDHPGPLIAGWVIGCWRHLTWQESAVSPMALWHGVYEAWRIAQFGLSGTCGGRVAAWAPPAKVEDSRPPGPCGRAGTGFRSGGTPPEAEADRSAWRDTPRRSGHLPWSCYCWPIFGYSATTSTLRPTRRFLSSSTCCQLARRSDRPAQPWRLTTFDAPGRETLNANSGMPYGLEDVRGYDSIIPASMCLHGTLQPQGDVALQPDCRRSTRL